MVVTLGNDQVEQDTLRHSQIALVYMTNQPHISQGNYIKLFHSLHCAIILLHYILCK